MFYYDYSWDLHPHGIIFDEELNIDKLGWRGGDLFEITNINGRAMLRKVDPVIAFTKGYPVNLDKGAK
jgi:hypothetical protein